MKRILLFAAMIFMVTAPANAARNVYLKDGGVIQAQSVWRSGDKVHVLVNRDTLTEFSPKEINMKRTFPKHKRPVVKRAAAPLPEKSAAAPPPAASQSRTVSVKKISMPSMPSLPQKNPLSLSGREEGAIKKHKKEMAEKAGE